MSICIQHRNRNLNAYLFYFFFDFVLFHCHVRDAYYSDFDNIQLKKKNAKDWEQNDVSEQIAAHSNGSSQQQHMHSVS